MKRKNIFIIFALFLVLVVIAGGLWFYSGNNPGDEMATQKTENIDNGNYFNSNSGKKSETKKKSVSIPETWKTHTLEKSGKSVQFSYPPKAKITTSTVSTEIAFTISGEDYSNDVDVLSFQVNGNKGKSVREIAKSNLSDMTEQTALTVFTDMQSVNVAGRQAYSYETGLKRGGSSEKKYRRTFVPVNGNKHIFITTMFGQTYRAYQTHKESIDKIIGSIKIGP